MDNTTELSILALCEGYGGITLGISLALENPLRVVAVEIEAYALANLVAKAEEGKLAIEALYPDVKSFPAERFSGCFDIITAGYPCQPFSCAGKRKGTEDPRHLWPDIERIIEAVGPVYGFFENVKDHLTLGFPEVYCSLRDMGYSVEAGLFTASEVGAPHRRQRLFILAHSQRPEPRLRIQQEPPAGIGGNRLAECRTGMADTPSQRTQGPESEGPAQAGRQTDEHGRILWPARPGQPQYEWEEPRVTAVENPRCWNARECSDANKILDEWDSEKRPTSEAGRSSNITGSGELADTEQRQRRGRAGNRTCGGKRQPTQVAENNGRRHNGQAQSGVGRAANGPSSRVDRLRLLGNGVVPAQAELAFRRLI